MFDWYRKTFFFTVFYLLTTVKYYLNTIILKKLFLKLVYNLKILKIY